MDTEPIEVALKFGFLAVLYLFLFWVARSAVRELRRTTTPAPEATGFHPIGPGGVRAARRDAWLVAMRGGGLGPGDRFDLFGGMSIGRAPEADVRVAEEAHRSDPGRQRNANEDAYYARSPLYAVADGMGGAQAGEVAARLAAEAFEPTRRGEESPEVYLRAIVRAANARIHRLAQADSSRSGMGTTLTAALVEGDDVSLAHVGDSRAYLLRENDLKLLTSDHSLVEELRRSGRLTDEQAEDHPQRSIITRALGPEREVEVDTMSYRARPGDVYLLCSDGLTTMVREERIAEILAESGSLHQAVDRLVREANDAGGRDNITVVAFRLDEAEAPAETPEGATLIGPAAEERGLTAEQVAAARREPVAAGAPSRALVRRRRIVTG